MSKTQLQTNNSRLSALITELQGKAAGGDTTIAYTVHIGSSDPTTDVGVDGDIYIKREAST